MPNVLVLFWVRETHHRWLLFRAAVTWPLIYDDDDDDGDDDDDDDEGIDDDNEDINDDDFSVVDEDDKNYEGRRCIPFPIWLGW